MSSSKYAHKIVEDGNYNRWDRMVEVAENKNWSGLGFQQGRSVVKTEDVQPSFRSEGFIHVSKPIEYNDHTPSSNFEFHVFEVEEEIDEEVSDELSRLLEHEEKAIHPFEEQIELVNLGSEDDVKEVKVGSQLCPEAMKGLIDLLQDYSDVFAWYYQDMPGLDSEIVEHKLSLKPECPPVKQNLTRTYPNMEMKIKEEVQKHIDVDFLFTAEYPQWVANIVPVRKKDGKVRMCVNYRDLNKASLKDDFPLPHIDMLVDNTAKFKVFSFMDGFFGYNQIKTAPEDMEKTTFITP
ncbi:hypothetical protein KIW84_042434 [Lathyrus oleraceus]|uniref:Reverse transcriptase domain-containing protein n=1 Tax=Pisum sativum TaxID=3888 RepID=A0A9D4XEB9_PEA|nr:hypothetical protein KIW84_042434 [Pisum sativum]